MTVLFSSFHNYLDFSSGAAITTREILIELARRGRRVATLCGALFDRRDFSEIDFFRLLKRLNLPARVRRLELATSSEVVPCREISFNDSGIDSTALFFDAESPRVVPPTVGEAFLRFFLDAVRRLKPRVYATYGGGWLAPQLADVARQNGARNLFQLHNAAYDRRELFRHFDDVVAPSEFLRRLYRARLGIECDVLAPLIDESAIRAPFNSRRFITFVNPSLEKGAAIFVALAREINRARPDVEFLVVEGRATLDDLKRVDGARSIRNLHFLKNGVDPRAFYSQTRVMLVPSLCEEAFGRIAVEAAFNAIPVLCSDRGALPEVLGDAAPTLHIPPRITTTSRIVPTREEISPWLDALLELLDDDERAQALGRRLASRATSRYSHRRVADETVALFDALARR